MDLDFGILALALISCGLVRRGGQSPVMGMRMGLLAGRVDGDVLVVRDAAPTLRRRYVVHRRSLDDRSSGIYSSNVLLS